MAKHIRVDIPLELLKSKRLFSDHIDILETVLGNFTIQKDNDRLVIGTMASSGALLSANIVGIMRSTSMKLTILLSGTCLLASTLFGQSSLNLAEYFKRKREFNKWKDLVDRINSYNLTLKRLMTYLVDLSCLDKDFQQTDKVSETTRGFTLSVMKVVKVLHAFVIQLDSKMNMADYVANYQPFEDLEHCEIMHNSEFTLSRFKELYKIFLYIQSQFLLRLCLELILIPDNRMVWKDVISISNTICSENDEISYQISKHSSNKKLSLKLPTPSSQDDLIHKLKWSSMTLHSKLLAQAVHFETINNQLQQIADKKPHNLQDFLKKVNFSMDQMESTLASSNYEFENFNVLIRKILNKEESPKVIETPPVALNLEEKPVKTINQFTPMSIEDEFFILEGQRHDSAGKDDDLADVDDNKNAKMLKSVFRPVLKQLKTKIDPLNEEMLARERQYLKLQGVEVEESLESAPVGLSSTCSTESEDELDDNFVLRKKKPVYKSRYDEHRQFLEQKTQVSMFGCLPPPQHHPILIKEEVLE